MTSRYRKSVPSPPLARYLRSAIQVLLRDQRSLSDQCRVIEFGNSIVYYGNPEHPYLHERGLTEETITAFGVGYFSGKGLMAGRIAIPIHNERGELVAYAGCAIGEPQEGEGKYKLPPKFHKSLVVFNLHRAKPLAKEQGLIVVEGFFDAMKVEQAGYPNVVALMGSSLSEAQEQLLVNAVGPGGKLALMFDEDEAGWKGREEALSRLSSRVYVRVIGLGDEGRQPDSLNQEEVTRMLRAM